MDLLIKRLSFIKKRSQKEIFTKVWNLIIPFMVCTIASSCSSEVSIEEAIDRTPINKIENYKIFGQYHNDFLGNAQKTFNTDAFTRANSLSVGDEDPKPSYRYLTEQQVAYAKTLGLPEDEEGELIADLRDYEPYYEVDKGYNECYAVQSNGRYKIVNDLASMYSKKLIDQFEYQLLIRLNQDVKKCYDGDMSPQFFQIKVQEYCDEWTNHFSPLSYEAGQCSAYILNICASSAEWWDASDYQTRSAVGAFVAHDAIHAIKGAAGQCIIQYIKNGRIVSWKRVGISALASGVVGSTGILGKIGRWLFK